MYKRALMLTAATLALLSGPVLAQTAAPATPITDKTTDKLLTDGNDVTLNTVLSGTGTVSSSGLIVIPSSSTDSTTPAVEINSSNRVYLSATTNQITFESTPNAVGIQADSVDANGNAVSTEVTSFGQVNLSGTGTDKTGILFGNPLISPASTTITGLVDDTTLNNGRITALNLVSGSTLQVAGDGSYGVHVTTGYTVLGDIVDAGAISTQATSLTATTPGVIVTGIEVDGTLGSATSLANLNLQPGGSVTSTGASAEGVVVLGQINGQIINEGSIEALGTATPVTTKPNPEAGSAMIIANNVTGGLYFNGPISSADSVTIRATLETTGTAAALNIVPGFSDLTGTNTVAPIVIGSTNDAQGVWGNVSLLNRGTISGVPNNVDDSSLGATLSGASTGNTTTFTNGIVNSGTISATSTTDKNGSGVTTASALTIGNYAIVNPVNGVANVDGTASPAAVGGTAAGAALINSNESGSGVISASVSGLTPGTATAINIQQFGNLPSLNNSGTISASAVTSDPTIASDTATAIVDQSGTLLNINNSGSITASSTALNNRSNIAQAINLGSASGDITLMNTGNIVGDVTLGASNDTITVLSSSTTNASIIGNINFGGSVNGGHDTLVVNGSRAVVSGNVLEQLTGQVDVTVENGATLNVTNSGLTGSASQGTGSGVIPAGSTLSSSTDPGLVVRNLRVTDGSILGLTVAQPFNYALAQNAQPIVQASGTINISSNAIVNLTFGSFVSSQTSLPSQFVVFDAPAGQLQVLNGDRLAQAVDNTVPFLFEGGLCSVNTSISGVSACSASPNGSSHSQLVLELSPKSPGPTNADGTPGLGLTGYANKMFTFANAALSKDSVLGADVIAAGTGLTGADVQTQGQKIYQGIYTSFAPDVTGASRAIAISITDQATGPVAARQRELRMYAGQDGDTTIWGQEFVQRLNISNQIAAGGYSNTGFGFVMGMDSGAPSAGRYGAAFTFFSGGTSEKAPRTSKTTSEWFMLTGYTDWRGKGLFFDSQLSAGYGQLTGKRSLVIPTVNSAGTTVDVTDRTAEGKRGAALLAGGATTGVIYNVGGTVFIPQISVDGLTMREEGYKESNNKVTTNADDGFDLNVQPYYASSLRAFAGADLRQDLNFGSFFVQPELRAGYRYDFIDGATKLRANFVSTPNPTFTISGPDPAKGNLVAGGGFAVTTGAWSIGLNYDYVRGEGGTGGINQTATLSLIGRI